MHIRQRQPGVTLKQNSEAVSEAPAEDQIHISKKPPPIRFRGEIIGIIQTAQHTISVRDWKQKQQLIQTVQVPPAEPV